jgi:hypothetical protein
MNPHVLPDTQPHTVSIGVSYLTPPIGRQVQLWHTVCRGRCVRIAAACYLWQAGWKLPIFM